MIMFSINVDEHLCSATSRKLQNIISNLDFKELLFCLHVLFGCWKFCCKQSCRPVLSSLLTPWTTKEIVLEAESHISKLKGAKEAIFKNIINYIKMFYLIIS